MVILKSATTPHLDQEPQVDILALGFFPVNLTVLVVPDVDSLEKQKTVEEKHIM